MLQNRRKWLSGAALSLAAIGFSNFKLFGKPAHQAFEHPAAKPLNSFNQNKETMKLGAFSISLNVKNLQVSREFYENLGFTVFAGAMAKNYLIMKNGNALIGLFQGMFQQNILTFNPGWDENAARVEPFDDIREIQRLLKAKGMKLETEADEKTSGPASLVMLDPDGNTILLDQHV